MLLRSHDGSSVSICLIVTKSRVSADFSLKVVNGLILRRSVSTETTRWVDQLIVTHKPCRNSDCINFKQTISIWTTFLKTKRRYLAFSSVGHQTTTVFHNVDAKEVVHNSLLWSRELHFGTCLSTCKTRLPSFGSLR